MWDETTDRFISTALNSFSHPSENNSQRERRENRHEITVNNKSNPNMGYQRPMAMAMERDRDEKQLNDGHAIDLDPISSTAVGSDPNVFLRIICICFLI